MGKRLKIIDPKRRRDQNGRAAWYPYYAGFSYDFAYTLIESAELPADTVTLDDWNGSGTTTAAASALGLFTYGFDLNPAMVVVAKARLLSSTEYSSVAPLSEEVIKKAAKDLSDLGLSDPLLLWFAPNSALELRKLEKSIQQLLVDHGHYEALANRLDFDKLSGIGAFLYLALFRTVRSLLKGFIPTNPTWVKKPRSMQARVRPGRELIVSAFRSEIELMVGGEQSDLFKPREHGETRIRLGDSASLPIDDGTIGFILTSPPYCTRIDYAVATRPELALLGYDEEAFTSLRRHLMGTSTVPKTTPFERAEWGRTCLKFLRAVRLHPSHASDTYYYKNHLQYFEQLHSSIRELQRVMSRDALSVLVVQDSYYKEIRTDLAQIVIDMASEKGLKNTQREDFSHTQNMAAVNPASRSYRDAFRATESVLVFQKAA